MKYTVLLSCAALLLSSCTQMPSDVDVLKHNSGNTGNPTYTVTYDGNGSTGGSVPTVQTKTQGVALTLASNTGSLVKSGYTFAGWNTTAGGSGTDYAAGASYTADADVKLYAKWTSLPTFTVTYDGNGSTGGSVPTAQTKTQGVALTLASNTGSLVKSGYTFAGWNTTAGGSGTDYAAGASYTADADVKLYAKWTSLPTFTVTYDGNGSTGGSVPTAQTKTQGVALTLASNTGSLVKSGYTFAGWNTTAGGSGTDYAAGASYTADADVKLYAKWTQTSGTSVPGPDVTDADGNVYHSIVIGTQTWTTSNLTTTKYNDNSPIQNVTDGGTWGGLSAGAYCWYNNDISNKGKYGALYNWYAVHTGKLAPAGWHVPADSEWTVLQNYLIANGYNWDNTTSGNKIAKSMAATTDWTTYSTQGTIGSDLTKNNSSGFSALPGGCRDYDGGFDFIGGNGYWWSATGSDATYAFYRSLSYGNEFLYSTNDYEVDGFSVRLVRD